MNDGAFGLPCTLESNFTRCNGYPETTAAGTWAGNGEGDLNLRWKQGQVAKVDPKAREERF